MDAETVLKWLGIAGLCGLKFLPGVGVAVAAQLGFWEQLLVTFVGGSFGTTVFTYAGAGIGSVFRRLLNKRRANRPPKPPQPAPARPPLSRRIWDRFGLVGVALLTPPLFSPPIGTSVAVAFGAPKNSIVLHMAASMLLWSVFFASLGQQVQHLLRIVGLG